MTTLTRVLAGAAVTVVLLAAGCGGTPGADADESETGEQDRNVQTTGFEDLGDVTLTMWSYDTFPGAMKAIEDLAARFEEQYPNVTVDITFRELVDYFNVIKLVMSGEDAPDIAQGNQGYQIDGALVEAGLISPLDDYAEAYGWTDARPESYLFQFRYTDNGSSWGEGDLYGIGQVGESVGVFYNKAKLAELGYSSFPATFAEFEESLAKANAAGERPIKLGNLEKWPIFHTWSLIDGAFTPPAERRDWVLGVPGATFDTPGTLASLETLKEWYDQGYFGDDLNAVDYATGITQFTEGDGVYALLGNWNAGGIIDAMGDNVGFVAMPPGDVGSHVANGAGGAPWHISSKSEHPDLAAAFIDYQIREQAAQTLLENGRVPGVEYTGTPPDEHAEELLTQWSTVVGDDGLTLYPDLGTPTMFDTLGASFQNLLGGKITPEEMISTVQQDWEAFQSERTGG